MSNLEVRKATYEDLVQVPDHLVAEIIDGVLYAQPRPAVRHSNASGALMILVGGPFHLGSGGPGGWRILDEPELHLREDIVVPDIAGWNLEHTGDIPDAAFVDVAPDWVCEVLSPRTQKLDRTRKMGIYAREGVQHVWLVDPADRVLEIYRLDEGLWAPAAVFHDNAVVRAEPFDAIQIKLAALWWDNIKS